MSRLLSELGIMISQMTTEEIYDQVMEIRKGRMTMTATKIDAVRKKTKKTSLTSLIKSMSPQEKADLIKSFANA